MWKSPSNGMILMGGTYNKDTTESLRETDSVEGWKIPSKYGFKMTCSIDLGEMADLFIPRAT